LFDGLKAENEAQAKRIAELEAAAAHLGLTPQQAKDGLARHKAQVAEIEALRKQVEAYKKEREPMRKAFADVKHQAERNRMWTGQKWHYYGQGSEKAYNSAVEMLKKLVANDLDLSSKNGDSK
jgi:hypothetical protein